jgi:hypothetical protein
MKKLFITVVYILFTLVTNGQNRQEVRGTIIDKETKMPLAGAIVILSSDTSGKTGTITDNEGNFTLPSILVGKQNFIIKYIGYQDIILTNVVIESGHQKILPIEMEISVNKLKEIIISTYDKKSTINEMATVSSRTFDVEETERYAGSRQDPARMASNFAGVSGTDDSRNDIVVRGNSPLGVLWRLEDIDIFNPNHFSIPGTSGGPLSIINNKTLSNSDFFTSAFPAEFGNSTSSVFDLKLRNGNNKKYEFSGQFGILGAEVALEGPISKKHKSSFIFAYRYATFTFLQALQVPIGTNSIPKYQDLTFKINQPIGKRTKLTVFGIGGRSHIDLIVSKFKSPPANDEEYGEDDRDQYFKSNMQVLGASIAHSINNTTFTKLTVSSQKQVIDAHHIRVYRNLNYKIDSMKNILGYNFAILNKSFHWSITKRLLSKHTIKGGIMGNSYTVNMIDSIRELSTTWKNRWNVNTNYLLQQAYITYKYKANDQLSVSAGLHQQYSSLNNQIVFEPRIGFKYFMAHKQSISAGYGLHSQLQPTYTYFYHADSLPASAMHNKSMGFTKSNHLVLGYDKIFSNYFRFKSETYFQYLTEVPIEKKAGSSFSLLNMGSAFERFFPDTLINKGLGRNYGIEITLEKFFHKGYYFMITGSLFDSKSKGNDKIWRNTDFNGNFIANVIGGTEIKIKNNTISIGSKITWGGGKRYSSYDLKKSLIAQEGVVIDALRNQNRFKNYFRADLKLGWKFNSKNITHEVAIDLVNILNTKNILGFNYLPDLAQQGKDPVKLKYQLGFLPLFYYKIEF